MDIFVSLFVTLIGAAIGAVTVCCFIAPMFSFLALMNLGSDAYKLDKIETKRNLNKKDAFLFMTNRFTAMSTIAACIGFIYCRFNPDEVFLFGVAIAEIVLAATHIIIGNKLKYQLAE